MGAVTCSWWLLAFRHYAGCPVTWQDALASIQAVLWPTQALTMSVSTLLQLHHLWQQWLLYDRVYNPMTSTVTIRLKKWRSIPKHFKGMYNLNTSLMPSRNNRLHRKLHYSVHEIKSICSQHSHVKYGKYHIVKDNDEIKMKWYVSHYILQQDTILII